MRTIKLLSIVAMAALVTAPAFAQRATLTDAQARDAIIRDSIARYLATGHPCACPYNTARNGSSCGGRSAYSRPGGASPLCYPKDVSDAMVVEWRQSHPKNQCVRQPVGVTPIIEIAGRDLRERDAPELLC